MLSIFKINDQADKISSSKIYKDEDDLVEHGRENGVGEQRYNSDTNFQDDLVRSESSTTSKPTE